MDVRITTRRVDAAEPFLRFAHERIRKLTRYHPRLQATEVVLEDDHGVFMAELRASVAGSPPLIARAEAASLRAALDQAANRLARQLRRRRSRRIDHQAPPAGALAKE